MTIIHVVIADDEPRIGELLRRTFTAYLSGIRISVVSDGQAALDLCSSQRVDLLLTDYLMPKMNGIDLARALRGRGEQLLIVLMSGGNVDWAAVNLCGVDFYIAKPWSTEDLSELLDRTRLLIQQLQTRPQLS